MLGNETNINVVTKLYQRGLASLLYVIQKNLTNLNLNIPIYRLFWVVMHQHSQQSKLTMELAVTRCLTEMLRDFDAKLKNDLNTAIASLNNQKTVTKPLVTYATLHKTVPKIPNRSKDLSVDKDFTTIVLRSLILAILMERNIVTDFNSKKQANIKNSLLYQIFGGMFDELQHLKKLFEVDDDYNKVTNPDKTESIQRFNAIVGVVERNSTKELVYNVAHSNSFGASIKSSNVKQRANVLKGKLEAEFYDNNQISAVVAKISNHPNLYSNFGIQSIDFRVDSCTEMIALYNKLSVLPTERLRTDLTKNLLNQILEKFNGYFKEYNEALLLQSKYFKFERIGWRDHINSEKSINGVAKPDIKYYITELEDKRKNEPDEKKIVFVDETINLLTNFNQNDLHFTFPFVPYEWKNNRHSPQIPNPLNPPNPPTQHVFIIGRANRKLLNDNEVCVPVFSVQHPIVDNSRHASIVFQKVGEQRYQPILKELFQNGKFSTANGTFLKLNKYEDAFKLTTGVNYTLTQGAIVCIGACDLDSKYLFTGPPGTPVKVTNVATPMTYEEYLSIESILKTPLDGGAKMKKMRKNNQATGTYKRTQRKHKCKDGKLRVVYTKGPNSYVKRVSKTTKKVRYEHV